MKHIKTKLNGGNTIIQCSFCNRTIRHANLYESTNPRLFPREYCNECLEKLINEYDKPKS